MKSVFRPSTVLFLSLSVAAALMSGCGGEDSPAQASALPADAAPKEVVAAYVKAINAHNKAAGRVLSTPYFANQEEGVVDSMFKGTRISNLRIDAPIPDNGYESPDGKRYQEAVNVPVTFDLQQREEVSMPNGHTAWGYTLVRAASDQPWRINDHGVG